MDLDMSLPFQEAVNPEDFPDYLDYVATPMDLVTVQNKLAAGDYEGSFDAFAKDVRLVWSNCMSYNAENSLISQHAAELSRLFEERLAKVPR